MVEFIYIYIYICTHILFQIWTFSKSEQTIDAFTVSTPFQQLQCVCSTLIQKQKRQGVCSLERTSLERVTLITLQLLCGIVFKRIAMVPRSDDPESFQRQSTLCLQVLLLYTILGSIMKSYCLFKRHYLTKGQQKWYNLYCSQLLSYNYNTVY